MKEWKMHTQAWEEDTSQSLVWDTSWIFNIYHQKENKPKKNNFFLLFSQWHKNPILRPFKEEMERQLGANLGQACPQSASRFWRRKSRLTPLQFNILCTPFTYNTGDDHTKRKNNKVFSLSFLVMFKNNACLLSSETWFLQLYMNPYCLLFFSPSPSSYFLTSATSTLPNRKKWIFMWSLQSFSPFLLFFLYITASSSIQSFSSFLYKYTPTAITWKVPYLYLVKRVQCLKWKNITRKKVHSVIIMLFKDSFISVFHRIIHSMHSSV